MILLDVIHEHIIGSLTGTESAEKHNHIMVADSRVVLPAHRIVGLQASVGLGLDQLPLQFAQVEPEHVGILRLATHQPAVQVGCLLVHRERVLVECWRLRDALGVEELPGGIGLEFGDAGLKLLKEVEVDGPERVCHALLDA